MRTALVLLFFLGMGIPSLFGQQFYQLTGQIRSGEGKPLSGVSVRLKFSALGTTTDKEGKFNLKLEEGYYTMVVSLLGFQTKIMDVTIKSDLQKVIVLEEATQELGHITVTHKKRDRGKEIMAEVMARRHQFRNQIQTSKSLVYIKATEETEQTFRLKTKAKKSLKKDSISLADSIVAMGIDSFSNPLDTLAKSKDTTYILPGMSIYEVIYTRLFQQPDKLKEIKEAAKRSGSKEGLFYLSTQEGNFDFYQGTMYIPGLSVNTFVTPVSPLAFTVYQFELKEYFFENGEGIYRIAVKPRALGNALMAGEVWVNKSDYSFRKVDLSFMPEKLNEYDQFRVVIEYGNQDTVKVPKTMELLYQSRYKKSKTFGRTWVHYQYLEINKPFPKKTFGDEVITTQDSAYLRDSSYWAHIRPEKLTIKEAKIFQNQDSIREAHSKKEYQDSVDKAFNKVTLLNVLWFGQGHVNRARKELWNFAPVVSFFNPVQIGGARVNLWASYSRTYPKRRTLFVFPNLNYGFRNQDLKGNISVTWLYNTFKRASVNVYVGRGFELVYGNEAYINLFKRSNFYEEDQFGLNHDIELFNGFYLDVNADFARRKSIANYKFGKSGTKIFGNVEPLVFDPYNALNAEVSIRYTPRQQYNREPFEKVILGSRYPTFFLTYRKGIKGVLGSVLDYDYWEASVRQNINFGIFGISEYRILGGRFLNTRSLNPMDLKIHRQADPYILRNPLYNYQLLPSTLVTYDYFVEGHYYHRFNGYFTQKIPVFKKLNINEVAGYSVLWAKEYNYTYTELFFGVERVFKIIRDRFRLGCYYVMAAGNKIGPQQGFRFSVEFYDRARNRFNF